MPPVSFYTPEKHISCHQSLFIPLKNCGFLMYSGVIERHQWHEMFYLIVAFPKMNFMQHSYAFSNGLSLKH